MLIVVLLGVTAAVSGSMRSSGNTVDAGKEDVVEGAGDGKHGPKSSRRDS